MVAKGKGKINSEVEKLLFECVVVTHPMWARSSRSSLLKMFRTWSDAEGGKNLSAWSLRLEDSSRGSLLRKEISEKKWRSSCCSLDLDPGKAQRLWWIRTTPLAGDMERCDCPATMLSWNLTWSGWWDQMNVSSTWLQLLWKYQAPVPGVNAEFCSSLLQIVTFPVPVTGILPEKTQIPVEQQPEPGSQSIPERAAPR